MVVGAEAVVIGCNRDDAELYPDCREMFLDALGDFLIRHQTPLLAPLVSCTKAQVVKHALRLGVPVHETWSCYAGQMEPCGTCGACQVRDAALREVGGRK